MFAKIRVAAIAAALCLILAGGAPVSFAQDNAEDTYQSLEDAHAAFLDDATMQTERPDGAVAFDTRQRSQAPGWLDAIGRFLGDVLSAIGPVLKILFYLGLAGIVLAIAYFVLGETLNIRFRKRDDIEPGADDDVMEDYRPDAAAARSLLEEADLLAKSGRYAEAVHLLLFRSIEDIQLRRDGGVPRSLTAREIGRLPTLPEKAKSALSPIIGIVERSFFGGRDVGADSWASARSSYEAFAFGDEWA